LLVTDTVGFVRDLPPWLVDAFESTLSAVYHADVVLLVVDVSDSLSEVRAKVDSCRSVLEGAVDGTVLPVLNKVDRCSDAHLADVRGEVGSFDTDPVAVSATEGTGVGRLLARICSSVPTARATFSVPNSGESQAFLSWAHDHGTVSDVEYGTESVRFEFVARPTVVEQARSKAADGSTRG
jgi:GTP-binding protein HflX